ncbi:MAG: hypothetical protein PVH73_03520 [Candidatus Bathyarchaeota archaeon]|jgi:hypothetical protein
MKKTILIVLLSLFLISTLTVPALAQDMTVGVSVGDWFKYEHRVTRWESEDPFLPDGYYGPLTLADNQTNFIQYTVTDITPVAGGNNVTFEITYDWENGSVTTGSLVETVTVDNQNIYMIGANLEPDDIVSNTHDWLGMGFFQYPTRFINETIATEYPTATRDTNVCEYTLDLMGTPYDYIYRWDKATGMRSYYESGGDVAESQWASAYNYTVVSELVDSSVAELAIPEFTGVIMLSLLIAITIPVVVYKRKH